MIPAYPHLPAMEESPPSRMEAFIIRVLDVESPACFETKCIYCITTIIICVTIIILPDTISFFPHITLSARQIPESINMF
jgi:hypothetical protein